MKNAKNYYTILQISRQATVAQIKEAYRRLARQYHPDLHPNDPISEDKFKEVCEAYEILINPDKRIQYDRNLPEDFETKKKDSSSAKSLYIQGINKALDKNYQGAIKDYNQAIKLKHNFLEAYVKRCEAYFNLNQDHQVLADCQSIIRIDSHCFEGYYYLGRSRQRLGYLNGAIEAYTQAIDIKNDSAYSYYYRALSYDELDDKIKALNDLHKAANIFEIKGDFRGLQLAQNKINYINKKINPIEQLFNRDFSTPKTSIIKLIFTTSFNIIIDPGGRILSSWSKLTPKQALIIGCFYGLLGNIINVLNIYINKQDMLSQTYLINLFILGLFPFISLTILSLIFYLINHRIPNLASIIFVVGASLLPATLIIMTNFLNLPNFVKLILMIFALCYTILILYNGCLQIFNFSEKNSAFVSSTMITIISLNIWLFS
ncbi:J domain-containing protein [Aphanothece sacrum]|uniref:Heat-shock protein n=1 Tax=Aphanothece sacrum FPU1 TaxID=1920663 RepID=A0A401IID8_APHSA|nr:bacterial transcriptional activator domain-containing protein [Aphanothece sacrum]GBF80956.1 heat-shock protein [Aphanothece sacrum FPU1]GBF85263.1 heat-shock protein [Aphanothece sacrum FPU3]